MEDKKKQSKYDKKLIDEMDKKGLFDNAYDSLVLNQSDEEREKLQKAVEKEKKKESDREEIKSVQPIEKPKKPKAKKLPWYMILIHFIQDLFFGKKGVSSSKFLQKREAKTILQDFSLLFYDFRIQKIRVSFPEYIYDIYNSLKELDFLFEELFLDENNIDFNQPIFFLDFIDNLIAEDEKRFLDSINEDYFYNIVSNEQHPEEALDEKLKELKNKIERHNQQAIIHYTSYFERFIYLSRYNFIDFFKTFDPHFNDSSDYKPKFQPVFGETNVLGIKKLNSHLRLIDFDLIPENILMHFDHILNAIKTKLESEIPGEDEKKEKEEDKQKDQLLAKLKKYSSNTILALHQKIQLLNKKNIIESLLKIMTNNYEYQPSDLPKKEGLFLRQYIKLTLAKKQFLYKKSYENIRATVIQGEILVFFNISSDEELLYMGNYTNEMSEKLKARGLDGFRYVLVTSIFKTFYEKIYIPNIKKTLNTLLVEGSFLNKREQSIFSEAYYSLDNNMDLFSALDSELSEGDHDIGQILRYASGEIADTAFQSIVQRKLFDLEERVKPILNDGFQQYKILLDHINLVLVDWKSAKPKLIANIKSIGASGNKVFMNSLIKSLDYMGKFSQIIDSLSVLKSEE